MTPWGMVFFGIAWIFTMAPAFAADIGGKPEKSDIVVSYAQPSGAFTPIWVAYEAGLFKNHGLNANLQLLTPQVSAQAVISEEVALEIGLRNLSRYQNGDPWDEANIGVIDELSLCDMGADSDDGMWNTWYHTERSAEQPATDLA